MTHSIRTGLIACAALGAAIFALYLPSLNAPFLHEWDDALFVTENPLLQPSRDNLIHLLTNAFDSIYIPIPMLSLTFDKFCFGLNPTAFRAHGLLLFWGCAALLFLLLREFDAKPLTAFLGTAIWVLNPQKAESVAWISERKDLTCGLFFFACVFLFVRSLRRGRIPLLASLAGILAVCSKPTAFPLPGILLALGLAFPADRPLKEKAKLLALPFLTTACAVVWAWRVTAQSAPFQFRDSVLVPLHNLVWHPATALLPLSLNPAYPETIRLSSVVLSAIAFALLFGSAILAAFVLRVPKRAIAVSILIPLGCMLPVIGLHATTPFSYCDRYNFLVSASVLVPLTLLAGKIEDAAPNSKARTALAAAASLLAILLAWKTMEYLPRWRSDRELFLYAWAQTDPPANFKVYESLCGVALHRQDDRALLRRIADELERFSDAPDCKRLPEGTLSNSIAALRAHLLLDETSGAADADKAARILGPLCDARNPPLFRTLRGMLAVDVFNLAMLKGDVARLERAVEDMSVYYGSDSQLAASARAALSSLSREPIRNEADSEESASRSKSSFNAAPGKNAAKESSWKF